MLGTCVIPSLPLNTCSIQVFGYSFIFVSFTDICKLRMKSTCKQETLNRCFIPNPTSACHISVIIDKETTS